jgi:hypothetical protein
VFHDPRPTPLYSQPQLTLQRSGRKEGQLCPQQEARGCQLTPHSVPPLEQKYHGVSEQSCDSGTRLALFAAWSLLPAVRSQQVTLHLLN